MIRRTSTASKTGRLPDPDNDTATASSTSTTSAQRAGDQERLRGRGTAAPTASSSTATATASPTTRQVPRRPGRQGRLRGRDGCPDPDNDKDGILDVDDPALTIRRTRTASRTPTAAPIPTTTRTASSTDDKCPNEPETYNGFEDEDGCPDKGRVIVRKGKLEILDKIYFETDKAIIRSRSASRILDAIAATLKGKPADHWRSKSRVTPTSAATTTTTCG